MAITPLERLTRADGVGVLTLADHPGALEADDRLTAVFFAGDPARRPESQDVAVVVGELMRAHGAQLRVLLASADDGAELMRACGVSTLPSLAFFKGAERLEVVPRIQDWSVYQEKTATLLARVRGAGA